MDFSKLVYSVNKNYTEDRIHRAKERLLEAWDLKTPKDRIPFVFSGIPDDSGVNNDRLYETGYSLEEYMYFHLYQIEKRAVIDDDYIPSFFPGCRQAAIPSAFGASEEKQGEHFWSKPIIKIPRDVYRLGEPNFTKKNSAAWRILENIKYCRKITKGKLPIHMSDMQGPMACASTMWDVNDYLMAMLHNPEEVHFLHETLKEAIIKFIDLQIEAAEGDFIPIHAMPFAWMPKEKGISLSNDLLALVGPEQLKEFSKPYDDEISKYYGGILIHSCGKFNHNLSALKKVKNLIAINFGATETDINDIIGVFGKSILYVPHSTDVASPPLRSEKQEVFIERVSSIIKENNLAAQVMVIVPSEYSTDKILELNNLALRKFTYL